LAGSLATPLTVAINSSSAAAGIVGENLLEVACLASSSPFAMDPSQSTAGTALGRISLVLGFSYYHPFAEPSSSSSCTARMPSTGNLEAY